MMDDGVIQTTWICEWVCVRNVFVQWFVVFLCPSLFSHAEYQLWHIFPTYSKHLPFFVLDSCNHYGHITSTWVNTHLATRRITGAGVLELCLAFSIWDHWCSGLSFLLQLWLLHSQIIFITNLFLNLYTTGQ